MATQRSGSDSVPRPAGVGASFSVAQLRAANVRIEWFEAVAVIAAVCQSVAETSDELSNLTADAVFIFDNGSVAALVRVQPPAELVRQICVLLSELLPDFHRRVSFHELLTTAMSTPPGYGSLDDLSRALAPFERPGRDAIIRDLYKRGEPLVEPAAPADRSSADRSSVDPEALERFVSERTLRLDAAVAPTTERAAAAAAAAPAAAAVPAPRISTPPPARTAAAARANPVWQDQRIQAAVVMVLAVIVISVCGWLLWTMWVRPVIAPAAQQQASVQLNAPSTAVENPSVPAPAIPVEQPRALAPATPVENPGVPAPPSPAPNASVPVSSAPAANTSAPAPAPPAVKAGGAAPAAPVASAGTPAPATSSPNASAPPLAAPVANAGASAPARGDIELPPESTRRGASGKSATLPVQSGSRPSAAQQAATLAPRPAAPPSTSARASASTASLPRQGADTTAGSAATASPRATAPRAASPAAVPSGAAAAPPAMPTQPNPPAAAKPSQQPAFLNADDASRIYTIADRDVTPPALTASQQLFRIPASSRPEDMMRVEVIVDEQGNVESAKSVDAPSSLSDAQAVAMSLSAAKSWHFRPALREGRPVRYRQVVPVTIR
jgi:hypothetical protein